MKNTRLIITSGFADAHLGTIILSKGPVIEEMAFMKTAGKAGMGSFASYSEKLKMKYTAACFL